LGLDAGLAAAIGNLVSVILGVGEQFLNALDKEFFGADNQDLVPPLLLEFPERHAVFLEEPDEVLTGDAAVLTARDSVATEPAGVEPFTHRARRDLTDFRDLAGGKNFFHGRHSNL